MKIKTLVKSAALAALVTLPASAQALDGFNCKVTEVYAFSNRVHVKCANSVGGDEIDIQYFAVPTSNSAEAARFTSMVSMALGGYLWIETYDSLVDDLSGPSFGCLLNDCRRPKSFKLMD